MSGLLNAVFANDLPKIVGLLDRDPTQANDVEALCQGIGWGRKDAVVLLIQRGADLNAIDKNGNHPLKMACQSQATDLFHLLVQHGSNPARANGLATEAAMCGRTDILRCLHQTGADLNCRDEKGVRPIEAAIGMGHVPAVEFLLDVNVDISRIDTSKPLSPWKGAMPDSNAMDEIRERVIAKQARR